MQIPRQAWLGNKENAPDDFFQQWVWEEIARVINGRLGFGNPTDGRDNIDGEWGTITSPGTPDVEFSLAHNLERTPVGWLTVSIDKAGIIYKGGTAWTTAQIFLKCDTATVALKVFIF